MTADEYTAGALNDSTRVSEAAAHRAFSATTYDAAQAAGAPYPGMTWTADGWVYKITERVYPYVARMFPARGVR